VVLGGAGCGLSGAGSVAEAVRGEPGAHLAAGSGAVAAGWSLSGAWLSTECCF
jgi:hypothetical protein